MYTRVKAIRYATKKELGNNMPTAAYCARIQDIKLLT